MSRKTPTYTTQAEIDLPLSGLNGAAFLAQDLQTIKAGLDGINVSAENVAKSLSKAFATGAQSSKAFNDTLATVGASLAKVGAGTLTGMFQEGFSSLLGGFGGALTESVAAPFAEGGIVSSPTYFGFGGGSTGLMGERGAEAILPLARGPNGQLGLAAPAAPARPVSVNVTIQTADAESFRRSESQVAGALARAVARGQRAL